MLVLNNRRVRQESREASGDQSIIRVALPPNQNPHVRTHRHNIMKRFSKKWADGAGQALETSSAF